MTTKTQLRNIDVDLLEKELIDVDLIEKEIIDVTLNQVDVIPRKTYLYELSDVDSDNATDNQLLQYDSSSETWKPVNVSAVVNLNTVYNEEPTQVTTSRFNTANNFLTGTIRVFLNGIKLKSSEVTRINSNTFELSEPIITGDLIEVNYIKN